MLSNLSADSSNTFARRIPSWRKALSLLASFALVLSLTPAWADELGNDSTDQEPAATDTPNDNGSVTGDEGTSDGAGDNEGEGNTGSEGDGSNTATDGDDQSGADAADGNGAGDPGDSGEPDDPADNPESPKPVVSAGKTVAVGWYALSPAGSTAKRLQIKNASRANGAAAVMAASTAKHTQYFKLIYSGGFYYIQNAYSLKYLRVSDGAVVQSSTKGAAAQWTIVKKSGGYVITNRATNTVLTRASGGTVKASKNKDAASQKWKVASKAKFVANGTYLLRSKAASKTVIDVKGRSIAQGARCTMATYQSSAYSQYWRFTYLKNGYYKIINRKSGRALTAAGGAKNGSLVKQAKYKGAKSQKWKVVPAGGGTYRLVNAANTAVSLSANGGTAGKALRTYTSKETSSSQRFIMKKKSFTMTEKRLSAYLESASGTSTVKGFNGGFVKRSSGAGKQLSDHVAAMRSRGEYVSFIVIDLKTGAGFSSQADSVRYSASTIKGPYVASICRFQPGSLSLGVTSTMGSTIRVSSNEGYASLRSRFGSGPMLKTMNATNASGFSGVTNYAFYTPTDLCQLWVGNYWYFFKDGNSHSKWCRSLYTSPYNSYIYYSLGDYYTTYSKPGWGCFTHNYGGPVLNDAGIVMKKGHPYMMAVLTSSYNRTSDMTQLIRLIDKTHTAMVS